MSSLNPHTTSAMPEHDWPHWMQACKARLQAQGLSLTDKQLQGVAKAMARMAQVAPMNIDEAHRDIEHVRETVRQPLQQPLTQEARHV